MPTPTTDTVTGLYEQQRGQITRYIAGLIGRPDVAQEMTQEVYLRAWVRRDALASHATPQARQWLFTTARNLSTDYLRRRALHHFEALPDGEWTGMPEPVEPETPEHEAERHEDIVMVHRVLATLPLSFREPLVLQHAYGLNLDEIGERIGMNSGSVRSLLYRARRAFARAVGQIELAS